jgi:hypothetical protein
MNNFYLEPVPKTTENWIFNSSTGYYHLDKTLWIYDKKTGWCHNPLTQWYYNRYSRWYYHQKYGNITRNGVYIPHDYYIEDFKKYLNDMIYYWFSYIP